MPAGLLVANGQLNVVAANRSFLERCRSEPAAIAGRPIVEVLGVPELELDLRQVLATDETRSGLLYTGRCPGTRERRLFRITVAGMRPAEEEEEEEEEVLLVMVEDLTEEEQRAAHLRALEHRFERTVEAASDAILVWERDGTISLFNAAAERAFGWRRNEVIGKPLTMLIPEQYRGPHRDVLARDAAGEGESSITGRALVLEAVRKDGSVFPIELTVSSYRAGDAVAVIGVFRDITERRRMEEALRKSESTLRSLVENAVFGIYRSTVDGRLTMVNRRLVEMLGYESVAELLEVALATGVYVDPDERARLVATYGDRERFEGVEVDWKRKDGRPIRVRLAGRALRDERGALEGFEVIVEDVQERQVLEQQLRQAQKMEAVGQLAGGMAHDFNNLLTTIRVTAELIAGQLPAGSPLLADLESIQEAACRGASLTAKILAFSRRSKLEVQTLDFGELLGNFTELARRLVPESIDVRVHLDPGGATVRADPGAIEQILMNLVTNARDAMPRGGKLLIETTRTMLDEDFCLREGWGAPGHYVALTVSDTGVGMDEETRGRVFEPFFTTKPVGEGTGLGMAMVYGLVKQHGGFVHVYSEPGRGTVVKVYFPLVSGAPPGRVARPAAEAQGGTETILLVEDDPALRRAAERVLTKHGYRVLVATDGRDALERIRNAPGEIDLLITDAVMPRMSGPQLLEALRSEGRRLRVLMTSGYSERGAKLAGDADAGVPYLAKPWTVQDLLRAVRSVLDA